LIACKRPICVYLFSLSRLSSVKVVLSVVVSFVIILLALVVPCSNSLSSILSESRLVQVRRNSREVNFLSHSLSLCSLSFHLPLLNHSLYRDDHTLWMVCSTVPRQSQADSIRRSNRFKSFIRILRSSFSLSLIRYRMVLDLEET